MEERILPLRFSFLFNVYTADIANTTSRKCMCTNEVGLVAQVGTFKELEDILNEDLAKVHFL